jgi:hypothetical protein
MADVIAAGGWDLARAQQFLFDAAPIARAPDAVHPIITGGAGVKMTCLVPWGGGTISVTRRVASRG